MNDVANQGMPKTAGNTSMAAILVVATFALILGTAWFWYLHYPRRLGLEQPISFSHRVHAGDKQIGCLICHPGAMTGARAGIPSVDTCMLCHERVIVTHPEILKLRGHYARRDPIQWMQVYAVPEFVYFNHEMHVRRQVDCGTCHGNIKGMDRVGRLNDFTMGFCVQCHRDNKVSHDCYVCHR